MDGFPNGRRLEDDVTTIELQAVSGVALAAIGLWYDDYTVGSGASPATTDFLNVYTFNAGVTKNDTTLKTCFPYIQAPWRGFNGPSNTTLPVTLLSFTATPVNHTVSLQWQVANVVNADHYDIESSTDANKYTKIGEVISKGSVSAYQYTDQNPSLTKTNFYRIKEVDKDGASITSAIRFVKFDISELLITPNPATTSIKITSTTQTLQISVYDVVGRKVINQQLNGGFTELNVSALPKGIYTVIAYDNNGKKVDTKKIVKQ